MRPEGAPAFREERRIQRKGNIMSMKLKVLGLGLLAVLATSAFTAINASASVSGHFTQEINTATITGEETLGTPHRLKFSADGGTPIECTVAHYEATPVHPLTFEEITFTPTYELCKTEGAASHNITVHHQKCEYEFYSNTNASANVEPHKTTGHATVGLWCPPESNGILVTHPNCTMRMPPQTIKEEGATYTTITRNGKHAITANITATGITAHYEAGICIFLGTNHTAKMEGSVTVWAENHKDEPVHLTAT